MQEEIEDLKQRLDEVLSQTIAQHQVIRFLLAEYLRKTPGPLRESIAEMLIDGLAKDDAPVPAIAEGNDQFAVWLSDTLVSQSDKIARLVRDSLALAQAISKD